MNPLELKLQDLERQIADIRRGMDIEFTESLRRNTLQGIIEAGTVSAATGNENETTSINIASTPQLINITHAEAYDQRVRVTIDGTDYYVGLYSV